MKTDYTLSMQPLLSVIIPVYNVFPYLAECMGSVLSQSCEEIEVILVDDGSTDGSEKICDSFRSDLAVIKVFHKKNGGLASARNAGMDASSGAYISFLDSDDRLAPGAIARAIEWIRKADADICFLNCEKFFPDASRKPFGCEVRSGELAGLSADDAIGALSRLDKFPDAAVIKLYKRSFLESNEIRFPDDGRFSEDLGFAIDCFLAARSFSAIDGPYYEYRQNREGSITNKFNSKHFFDLVTFVDESAEKLIGRDGLPRNSKCESCLSFVAYELSIMTWMLSVLSKADRKRGVQMLEKYAWVMPYGRGRKARLVHKTIDFFGFAGTSWLLALYMHLR